MAAAPPPPLTHAQKLAAASDFYPTRKLVRQPAVHTAEFIVQAMTEVDNPATGNAERAVLEHLALPSIWQTAHIPQRTNMDMMLHLSNIWLACQGYQWDPDIENHCEWVDGHYTRPAYSQKKAVAGIYPFICINVILGPTTLGRPVAEWRPRCLQNFAVEAIDSNCLLIPWMQAIWAVGDPDQELINVTWRKQHDSHNNVVSWFQNIQNKIKKYGIYSTEYVARQCRRYSAGGMPVRPNDMVKGVSVEIVKVLAYLRSDLIFPADHLWYCSNDDKTQIVTRRLYHPNPPPVQDDDGNIVPGPPLALPRFIL